MSACGDIIEMEMTEGKLLKDKHHLVAPWMVGLGYWKWYVREVWEQDEQGEKYTESLGQSL